ncbi:MAG: hypothetical protein N2487_00175 [Verrucomicrobiae bacterium]|nr:hypothetical protein [Verrucomicrobiae bacterium]
MNNKNLSKIVLSLILACLIVETTFAQDLTLGEALDYSNVTWLYGGDAPWIAVRSPAHDGVDAAQTGKIYDEESSAIGAYFTGPGKLSFWWKVSSEFNADLLWFFVNGEAIDVISGYTDWKYVEVRLSDGLNMVVWEYTKDETLSEGLDAGWLDEVKFTPDNPQPSQPRLNISYFNFAVVLSWELPQKVFLLEETDNMGATWQKSSIPMATNNNIVVAVVTNLVSKKFFRLKSD